MSYDRICEAHADIENKTAKCKNGSIVIYLKIYKIYKNIEIYFKMYSCDGKADF